MLKDQTLKKPRTLLSPDLCVTLRASVGESFSKQDGACNGSVSDRSSVGSLSAMLAIVVLLDVS